MSRILPKMESHYMQLEKIYFFPEFIHSILLAVLKLAYLLHADLKLVILLSRFVECWEYMGILPDHSFLILIVKYVPILKGKSNLIYHFGHLKKRNVSPGIREA